MTYNDFRSQMEAAKACGNVPKAIQMPTADLEEIIATMPTIVACLLSGKLPCVIAGVQIYADPWGTKGKFKRIKDVT